MWEVYCSSKELTCCWWNDQKMYRAYIYKRLLLYGLMILWIFVCTTAAKILKHDKAKPTVWHGTSKDKTPEHGVIIGIETMKHAEFLKENRQPWTHSGKHTHLMAAGAAVWVDTVLRLIFHKAVHHITHYKGSTSKCLLGGSPPTWWRSVVLNNESAW